MAQKSHGILGEIQRSCEVRLSAKELGLACFQMHMLFMTVKSACFQGKVYIKKGIIRVLGVSIV